MGHCIPLKNCKSLLKLFSVAQSEEAKNFFIQAQKNCGFRNIQGDPLLCCVDILSTNFSTTYIKKAPEINMMTLLLLSTTSETPLTPSSFEKNKHAEEKNCVGPNGVPGNCIGMLSKIKF